MRAKLAGLAAIAALGIAACEDGSAPGMEEAQPVVSEARKSAHPLLVAVNRKLEARGAKVRVPWIEYRTAYGTGRVGQQLFAFDRGNKQLEIEFVPGDPRRGGRTNITYLVDQSDGATHTANPLTSAQTEAAIDRAMGTWEAVGCSKLSIDKVTDTGVDPDVFDGLIGVGGVGTPFQADVVHAGWLPAAFFDALVPQGSQFILAATIPFVFDDEDGAIPIFFADENGLTDIDGDKRLDYAFAEIFYNDAFGWGIDAFFPLTDVEGTALHETGHGLGQAHFGKIFITLANGKVHFSPFAVMNAVDPGFPTQVLQGSDIGGHCSIWASWPNP
jgi:hypothetical protein